MSLLRDFPSLIGKTGSMMCEVKHIQEHCLDKQKVKDAIDKICIFKEDIEGLYKELGLNDN
jgi:hypothetical protein